MKVTLRDINGKEIFSADVNTEAELVRLAIDKGVSLEYADLSGYHLNNFDFSGVSLFGANLNSADLNHAKLISADLSNAKLHHTYFRKADLTWANLTKTSLYKTNLSEANLTNVVMSQTIVCGVNLSEAIGLVDNSKEFLSQFKLTRSGLYVYKAIGNTTFHPKSDWVIKPGQYLEENVNSNRFEDCGCGVNFGTLQYVSDHYPNSPVWLCLIETVDLVNVVVPYNTSGKARCSRLKLIRKVNKTGDIQ